MAKDAPRNHVLVTWNAYAHDPFLRGKGGITRKDDDGKPLWGPTLSLLFDEASAYKGKVGTIEMLIAQTGRTADRQEANERARSLIREIQKIDSTIKVNERRWTPDSAVTVIDHAAIWTFLKEQLPSIRETHAGSTLVFNVSPGTPAMHTMMVLAASTGFVDGPLEVVQGTAADKRRPGQGATTPVNLSLDTFLKRYQGTRPSQIEPGGSAWDFSRVVSDRLKAVAEQARLFASSSEPVLILGPRGAGKTQLASYVRAASPFQDPKIAKEWPVVNCGQFSDDLVRSELFGHEAGSFTGAQKKREGLLSVLDKDTLFLDEIGDLSRYVQRLMIRAVEEHLFTRTGSNKPERSGFRLLSATNLPIAELRKRLDPDFLDRISTFVIRLPALREIPEELPWLWPSIWNHSRKRISPVSEDLSERDHTRIVDHLSGHPLPGNMRDLQRSAHHILVLLRSGRTVSESIESGLRSGLSRLDEPAEEESLSRAVAGHFSRGEPLDPLFNLGPIALREVRKDLNGYVATEAFRFAKTRPDVRAEDLISDHQRRVLYKYTSAMDSDT